jgi:hypothetical protein
MFSQTQLAQHPELRQHGQHFEHQERRQHSQRFQRREHTFDFYLRSILGVFSRGRVLTEKIRRTAPAARRSLNPETIEREKETSPRVS